MAINFPTSPAVNDIYTYLGVDYKWDGQFWAPQLSASWAAANAFPAGTLIVFQQASAPTLWTKQTTHNDKALRIMGSGTWTSGSGSAQAFSAVLGGSGKTATDALTVTTTYIGSHWHNHGTNKYTVLTGSTGAGGNGGTWVTGLGDNFTNNEGSGTAHGHGIDTRVNYCDAIVAAKD